jgi:hypothetical protein
MLLRKSQPWTHDEPLKNQPIKVNRDTQAAAPKLQSQRHTVEQLQRVLTQLATAEYLTRPTTSSNSGKGVGTTVLEVTTTTLLQAPARASLPPPLLATPPADATGLRSTAVDFLAASRPAPPLPCSVQAPRNPACVNNRETALRDFPPNPPISGSIEASPVESTLRTPTRVESRDIGCLARKARRSRICRGDRDRSDCTRRPDHGLRRASSSWRYGREAAASSTSGMDLANAAAMCLYECSNCRRPPRLLVERNRPPTGCRTS